MADEDQLPTLDRRRFLTVLGASGAGAAALSGCSTDKVERLIPYLVQSEDQVPGISTFYASSCTECPTGCGVHVRTREGRAVKLEGNPDHPVNQGKLCSQGQAALQGLYNPGRLKGPMARDASGQLQEITWDDAIARLAGKVSAAGTRVAAISGAGRGTFSDLLSDWVGAGGPPPPPCSGFGGGRGGAGGCGISRPLPSRSVRRTGRFSARISSRATTSPRPSTSSRSGLIFWRAGPAPSNTSAVSLSRTDSLTAALRSSSTSRRGATSPVSMPISGTRFVQGPRRRWRSPWQTFWQESGAERPASAACWRNTRLRWRRRRLGCRRGQFSNWLSSSALRAQVWRLRVGSPTSMPAQPTSVRRSTC